MTLDSDGQIRMDPSSEYAMAGLIGLKDRFDVAFANDTDADQARDCHPQPGSDAAESLPGRGDRVPF